jgi:hypothetical protein
LALTEIEKAREARKEAALAKLKEGCNCVNKGCEGKAVIVYLTSCHGDWFFCQPCDDKYQAGIKEIDKNYGRKND